MLPCHNGNYDKWLSFPAALRCMPAQGCTRACVGTESFGLCLVFVTIRPEADARVLIIGCDDDHAPHMRYELDAGT
ncbi:hypothetical protein RF55_23907 [Lasius niger]|uniref:Uncharacterized protein n=1 Tax=Lasius niger TaxID=67767 RepID=A0A0J7JWC8_LASNI|nr:hypothetical protein RF55_23907 [Lasius niger]